MDDFIILRNNKKVLEYYKRRINKFLKENLKIELHQDKSKIYPINRGINFLGFRNFYYHKILKKNKRKKPWNSKNSKGLEKRSFSKQLFLLLHRQL